jgi:hypothetical protein
MSTRLGSGERRAPPNLETQRLVVPFAAVEASASRASLALRDVVGVMVDLFQLGRPRERECTRKNCYVPREDVAARPAAVHLPCSNMFVAHELPAISR